MMRDSLIAIACYLQKNLPLDSGTLKDAACLSPVVRDKDWTIGAIKRLALKVPHIISEREVSLVADQWMIYQAEDIPIDWEEEQHMDTYWSKVFKLKSGIVEPKLFLLSKVVKSFLCLHNGNAEVERSLSDNKNTLTAERTKLSDETLGSLRKAKEHARSYGGAHCVNTTTKGTSYKK